MRPYVQNVVLLRLLNGVLEAIIKDINATHADIASPRAERMLVLITDSSGSVNGCLESDPSWTWQQKVALVSAKSGGGLMGIWKRHQHGQSSDVIAEEFIKQKTVNKETGELTYTHDSVRRAYIHLHRALPNMFKYIDDPGAPNNTNGLESFFGHLKDNLRIHRGMSLEHRNNFIKWYLFFVNEKKKKAE